MRKFILMLLSAALLVSFNVNANTSGVTAKNSKVTKAKKCFFPKSRKRAPDWVCQADNLDFAFTAVGSFHKSGAGIEFMEQMAAADARVHLARKLRGPLQKKIIDTQDADQQDSAALDSALLNKITDEQLQGTKVVKSVYGPKGRLYVLLGIDEAGALKLQESIAENYLQQKRK
jgi:LPP20 lipoprotein